MRGDNCGSSADRVPVKENRFINPFENGFDILGKSEGIHKAMGARMSVIACAVQNRAKTHISEYAGTADHAITIAAPSMGQKYDAVGGLIRFNAPDFDRPAVFGR